MLTVINATSNESDLRYGYQFGVDGLVTVEQVSEMLGGPSIRTVERRIRSGKFRTGRDEGRLVICKRSVLEYIAGLER